MKLYSLIGLTALVMGCGNSTIKTTHQSVLTEEGVVPGAIVVDMKDNVSDSDIADLSKIAGTELHADNPTAQKYKYEEGIVDPSEEDAILERLKADPRVEHAEPVVEYHALWTPNDPMYSKQWGLSRIGTESSWGMNCGYGAKVAVLDTGVACGESKKYQRIKDLASCEGGYDFVYNTPDFGDAQSHGSHVSSTIAELTDNDFQGGGIAPCSTILPVKVLSDGGSGSNEGIAEGIRFAADQGANIINMSLGGPHPSDILKDAVKYAYDKGVIVIAAAGNSGGKPGYPAAFPHVVAVSAIDNTDTITNFSCRGPEIAIAAPGKDIGQSTICKSDNDGCFETYSGTSMASPMVAGAAALLVGQGITNPDAIQARLQSTADPKNDAKLYGAGILRADNAVKTTILSHFYTRAIILLAALFFFRKKLNIDLVKSKLSMVGVVLGGFGLFPLMFTGLMPRLGALRWIAELVARPVGEWDVLAGFHNHLVLASFVPATILSLLLLGHSKAKLFAGGFSLGAGVLATQIAYSNEVNFTFGSLIMRVIMIASAGVCAYFVNHIFTKKTA